MIKSTLWVLPTEKLKQEKENLLQDQHEANGRFYDRAASYFRLQRMYVNDPKNSDILDSEDIDRLDWFLRYIDNYELRRTAIQVIEEELLRRESQGKDQERKAE